MPTTARCKMRSRLPFWRLARMPLSATPFLLGGLPSPCVQQTCTMACAMGHQFIGTVALMVNRSCAHSAPSCLAGERRHALCTPADDRDD